ncbi:hypothetical protein LEP1GSC017_3005 [Leptospira meyeri serovar Hardjo str. Went 5]|nr:hypothetical protein LEP1GSC017_3005 [Leptospira meyeri serovar Hardjo str. Went 5]
MGAKGKLVTFSNHSQKNADFSRKSVSKFSQLTIGIPMSQGILAKYRPFLLAKFWLSSARLDPEYLLHCILASVSRLNFLFTASYLLVFRLKSDFVVVWLLEGPKLNEIHSQTVEIRRN